MPKPFKQIDYSQDSMIKANQRIAKVALKNIQPPPVPQTDMETITETVTNQPVGIADTINKSASLSSTSTVGKDYTELLKLFSYLSHIR